MQTPSNIVLGSKKHFGKYGASYKIIPLTPRRLLKTQIFEEPILSMEKFLGQSFLISSKFTNLREPQGASTRCSENYCASYTLNTLGPKRLTKFVQKKSIFLVKKNRPTLSRITEHGRPQATFFKAAQGILATIVQVRRSFL